MNKKITLDATLITALQGCQRRFVLRYLLGSRKEVEDEASGTSALNFGTIFHKMMDKAALGKYPDDVEEEELKVEAEEAGVPSGDVAKNAFQLGQAIYARLKYFREKKKEGYKFFSEVCFTLEYPEQKASLVGFFDLVEVDPGGKILLVDYKTSGREPPQPKFLLAGWQARIYLEAAKTIPGFEALCFNFYKFLKKGWDFCTYTFGKENNLRDQNRFYTTLVATEGFKLRYMRAVAEKEGLGFLNELNPIGDAYVCSCCFEFDACSSVRRHNCLPSGWGLHPEKVWKPEEQKRGLTLDSVLEEIRNG